MSTASRLFSSPSPIAYLVKERGNGMNALVIYARRRYQVEIVLDGDREIVAVLGALVKYVTARGDGSARLELDGHRYILPPQPGLNELAGVEGKDEPEPQPEAAGADG